MMNVRCVFLICIVISLAIHAAVFLCTEPVVDGRSNPVMTGWPDLLSARDLAPVSSGRAGFDRKLMVPAPGREYFIASLETDPLVFSTGHREVLRSSSGPVTFEKRHVPLLTLAKEAFPFWDIFEKDPVQFYYRTEVDTTGRIVLVIPLKLPLHSPALMDIEEQVSQSLAFVGRDNFYWTRVEVVIE